MKQTYRMSINEDNKSLLESALRFFKIEPESKNELTYVLSLSKYELLYINLACKPKILT